MKKSVDSNVVNLINKKTKIKFVKKAQMWCKTSWDGKGEQRQEWSIERPDESS